MGPYHKAPELGLIKFSEGCMRFEIDQEYCVEEHERIKRLFSRKKHGQGFKSREDFANWWVGQLSTQGGCCTYCQTPIRLIEMLIREGRLNARSTRGLGKRGLFMELERFDPKGPYRPDNCALACYYCNNDKSYIFSAGDFKKFLAPSKREYFEHLLSQSKKSAA